jgi:hypothetical protein
MEPNLVRILRHDFKDLYKELEWGVECESGWFDLIYNLSCSIHNRCSETSFTQIKEKYGGLRISVTSCGGGCYKDYDAWIAWAEAKSYRICEWCGAPGKLRRSLPYILTLCDACEKDRLKRNGDMIARLLAAGHTVKAK